MLHTREPTRFTAVEYARPYLREKKKERKRERERERERGGSEEAPCIVTEFLTVLDQSRDVHIR